jgi:nicotinamidase-related amidase
MLCSKGLWLAAAMRGTGGGVFWIKMDACWAVLQRVVADYEPPKPEYRAKLIAVLFEGTLDHELWPELDVGPENATVEKYRHSAFMPGTSALPERLRARGFDTPLITGIVTNVCCETPTWRIFARSWSATATPR